jgi:NhaP-type Na+/H+ and K+/H+ antiporter
MRLHSGGFDCAANNSFAQMLPAFALAMIGVGLAAPAAMSTLKITAGISLVLSTFFIVTAVLLALIVMVMSVRPCWKTASMSKPPRR